MVADGEGRAAAGWDREPIAGCGMDGDEALQSTRGSDSLHHPFSFSKEQVAVFSAFVEALVGPVIQTRRDFAICGTRGSQFFRNDPFG